MPDDPAGLDLGATFEQVEFSSHLRDQLDRSGVLIVRRW